MVNTLAVLQLLSAQNGHSLTVTKPGNLKWRVYSFLIQNAAILQRPEECLRVVEIVMTSGGRVTRY